MNKSGFNLLDDLQTRESLLHRGETTQELFDGESHILQLICARAPLGKILNEVCYALNCQIGNVVSVLSLSDPVGAGVAATAQKAAIFGLFGFFSADVAAENGKLFATLDLYSSVSRSPSPFELESINRAVTLAAIAIARRDEASQDHNFQDSSGRLDPEFIPAELALLN